MGKLKVHSLNMVLDMFKVLADNPYSLLWDLVDDFTINGHSVSVKDSTQYESVIIDGVYQKIGGKTVIVANGVTYKNPLDYVEVLLKTKKGEDAKMESLDFGNGTTKEIREAIAGRMIREDDTIAIFSPSSKEYRNLELAAEILSAFTGKDYFVRETYFDYGQGWKWTTILKKDPSFGSVQALNPKEQKDIITANTGKDLGAACDAVINRKPYV